MIISSLFTILSIIDDFNIKLKFTKFLYKLFCIVIVKLTQSSCFFWFHGTNRSKRGLRSSWSISQQHHIVKPSQEALYYITGQNFMMGGCRKFYPNCMRFLNCYRPHTLNQLKLAGLGNFFGSDSGHDSTSNRSSSTPNTSSRFDMTLTQSKSISKLRVVR